MDFNKYQEEAMSFRMDTATDLYALLSLSAEVGELHTLVSKALRDGAKDDFRDQVKKELGDILWNIAAVAADGGFALEEIAAANIEKLSSRKQRGVITGSGDNR